MTSEMCRSFGFVVVDSYLGRQLAYYDSRYEVLPVWRDYYYYFYDNDGLLALWIRQIRNLVSTSIKYFIP